MTDTKVKIKRLGLLYNMDSSYQIKQILKNSWHAFREPWVNINPKI